MYCPVILCETNLCPAVHPPDYQEVTILWNGCRIAAKPGSAHAGEAFRRTAATHRFRMGNRGSGQQILYRGEGKGSVTKATSGEDRELAVLESGDHFGEIAPPGNVPRTATLPSLIPFAYLTLSRSQLHTFLEKAPGLWSRLKKIMEGRIQARNQEP